ncbi:hypothetical protein PAHAL_5G293800 [Panicum hallii]|uniref:Uncharacterized protein n=1 Tax=Panicum hallii TaxID=206008 RepID=A0A2T8ILM4_9POAL|nr:hypothetical protein PAHAL_5G293800 [Panicum hallii]PVH38578.1 hypothetical protein PAHAL_5G293800 [Panicum hallii]
MALPAEPRADLPPPRRCLPPPPLLRSHRPTPTGERKIGRELAIQLLPRHPTHDAGSSRALAASPRSDIPAAPPACGLPADVPYLPLYFIWQVLAASPPVQSRHHGAAPKPAGFSGQIRPSPPLVSTPLSSPPSPLPPSHVNCCPGTLEIGADCSSCSPYLPLRHPRRPALPQSRLPTIPPRRRCVVDPQPRHRCSPTTHRSTTPPLRRRPQRRHGAAVVPSPSRRPAVSPLGDQGLM